MHEASEGLPMRQLIDIPSCVPAVPGLEHAGAEFGPAQIEELAKLERVVGLAEVMDYLDVIHGGDRMMDIIRTAESTACTSRATPPLWREGCCPPICAAVLIPATNPGQRRKPWRR